MRNFLCIGLVVLGTFAIGVCTGQEQSFSGKTRRYSQQPSWVNRFDSPRRNFYGRQTLNRLFDSPSEIRNNPTTSQPWTTSALGLRKDGKGRVQMGVANSMCDDAKANITMDWNMSRINYTCFHPETRFPRDDTLPPEQQCDRIPPRYSPSHICMDQQIEYKDAIPTHGDHRPLWPMFGEYIFVPRERWSHNIEHGGIVMLFHPCANPVEVKKLKNLVKNCVGKHVISPSTFVPPERPLVLVSWGCRLLMASVDETLVKQFIYKRAHKGPEGNYEKEGQYTFGLLESAKTSGNGATFGYSRVQCV